MRKIIRKTRMLKKRYKSSTVLKLHLDYFEANINKNYEDADKTLKEICKYYRKKSCQDNQKSIKNDFNSTINMVRSVEQFKNDDFHEHLGVDMINELYDELCEEFSFNSSQEIVNSMYILNARTMNIGISQKLVENYIENNSAFSSVLILNTALTSDFGIINLDMFYDFLEKIRYEMEHLEFKFNNYLEVFSVLNKIQDYCNIEIDLIEKLLSKMDYLLENDDEIPKKLKKSYLHSKYVNYIFSAEELLVAVKKHLPEEEEHFLDLCNNKHSYYLQKVELTNTHPAFVYARNRYIDKRLSVEATKLQMEKTKNDCVHSTTVQNLEENFIKYYNMAHLLRYTSFWADMSDELNKIKSKSNNGDVIFFINDYSLVCGTNAFPFLMAAKNQGIDIVPTSARTIDISDNIKENAELFALTGVIDVQTDLRNPAKVKLKENWIVDIKNKFIGFDGMNFYQPIYEFVSRYQFEFFYNYDTDLFTRYKTGYYMALFENIINYIKDIEVYAKKHNVKVHFVGFAPHFPHNAAYRIYCEHHGEKSGLNYIVTAAGYDNYFNNISDAKTHSFCALNLTKNRDSRSCFLGTLDGFEEYYLKTEGERNQQMNNAKNWIQLKRSNAEHELNERQKKIISTIEDYRNRGKKIFVANGKVVFDLAVFYTSGIIHDDMSDWITKSIDIMNDSEHLLIVKPHPHEKNQKLTMTNEKIRMFVDLIKTNIPDNVIVLDNHDFNLFELVDYIDCALLWNGTSSLEFAVMDIPVYMFDEWAFKDYPIGFTRLNSTEEYVDLLVNGNIVSRSDLIPKAVAFLNYMGCDEVARPNPYAQTSSLNLHQLSTSKINSEYVDDYLANGNDILDDFVKEILDS